MRIHAERIIKTREKLNKQLSIMTGQPLERIRQDTDRDNFMDADEAVKYGIIDKVIQNRNAL